MVVRTRRKYDSSCLVSNTFGLTGTLQNNKTKINAAPEVCMLLLALLNTSLLAGVQ